jgi:hypothetical protein
MLMEFQKLPLRRYEIVAQNGNLRMVKRDLIYRKIAA